MSIQDHEELQIVWMHRKFDSAWLLMPQFKLRVAQFCADLEQGNPEPVVADFMACFGAGGLDYFGVILVNGMGEVKGHLLCKMDIVLGERVAFVHQWQKDCPTDPEIDVKINDAITKWATVNKAQTVRICTVSDEYPTKPTNARARLFRKFGYEPSAQISTRRL